MTGFRALLTVARLWIAKDSHAGSMMSNLSIRKQVMMLAGAFTALLMASVAVMVFLVMTLSETVFQTTVQQDRAAVISDINAGVYETFVSVLQVARSQAGANEALAADIEALTELRSRMEATFGAEVADQRGALDQLFADVQLLSEMTADLQSIPPFDRSVILRDDVIPLLQAMLAVAPTVEAEIDKALDTAVASKLASFEWAQMLLFAVSAIAVVTALGLSWMFSRLLVRPIVATAKDVERLAGGDYDIAVDTAQRGDEIGQIGKKLVTLRDRLAQNKAETERERSANERRIALFDTMRASMGALRDGQLDQCIDGGAWSDLGSDYVTLCEDFNDLSAALQKLVTSVRASIDTVKSNADELATMSMDMSKRAEVQAATLEESAAALEELSSSVKSAAARAKEADEKVVEGRRRAQQGGEVMDRALAAMGSISKSSEKIAQIIGVIDDIAFQTNLLALNAGVEAARAGESGKGFSVVASEVRSLAQRASESAKEIKDLVFTSTQQVEDGERLVQETSATLKHLVQSVTEVSDLVSDIANAAQEQASGVQEITVGVAELDKATQQGAALVNETSAAGEQLTHEVSKVAERLAAFLGEGGAGALNAAPSEADDDLDFIDPTGRVSSASFYNDDNAALEFDAPTPAPVIQSSAQDGDGKRRDSNGWPSPDKPEPRPVAEMRAVAGDATSDRVTLTDEEWKEF